VVDARDVLGRCVRRLRRGCSGVVLPLAVLALTGGCERRAQEVPPPAAAVDAGAAEAQAEERPPAPPSVVGVRVETPPGWRSFPGEDGSIRAGPASGAVLRLDRQPRAAASFPSPAALREGLGKSLKGVRLERVEEEEGEGLSLVFFEVVAGGGDAGGSVRAQPGFVGARVVGNDYFLCASLPGATPDQVRAAAGVCTAMRVGSPEDLPGGEGRPQPK
jgi:hypothetical protein